MIAEPLAHDDCAACKAGLAGLVSDGANRRNWLGLRVDASHMRACLVQRHSHSMLLVHVVWSTTGRAPLLETDADGWLADTLRRRTYEVGCRLVACGNAANHVHVLLRYPSTVRLADVMHRLKGGSSYEWNVSRRSPRLSWQPGYWAESFGIADLPALATYLEQQRAHHGDTASQEPWQAASSETSST